LDVCGVLGYSKVVFLLSHGFKPFYASIISVSTLFNMQVSFRWNARCVWYILSTNYYVPAYEFIRVYSVLSFSFEIIYIVHKPQASPDSPHYTNKTTKTQITRKCLFFKAQLCTKLQHRWALDWICI